MNDTDKELENMIVPTEWTDRDTDIVVQAKLHRMMGLKPTIGLD